MGRLAWVRGAFSTDIAADLATGAFIRVTEWRTAAGTLRFGIPRRIDGLVRMELQHRAGFPPVQQTSWSVDIVR